MSKREKETESDREKNKEDNSGDDIKSKNTTDKPSELEIFKDKYLRLHAEFDNYRKQMEIERERAKIRGAISVIEKFIVILDDLEQADAKIKDKKTDASKGMRMIFDKIKSTFDKLNVRELNVINKKYNPQYCEVVGTEKTNIDDDIVLKVVRKGYTYKDYVIRPAIVIVSKKAEKGEENKENEKKVNKEIN